MLVSLGRAGTAARRVAGASRLLSTRGAYRPFHSHVFSVFGRDEGRLVEELRTQLDHATREPVPAGGWTMLYALDKHLPPAFLQQSVSLLRSSDAIPNVQARVGALTGSWPFSALPGALGADVAGGGVPCISVALLPASLAVAFRSKIKGKRAISVGRWQPLDVQRQWSSSPPAGEQEELWSKSNPAGSVPDALAPYVSKEASSKVIGTLILSDPAPQGLIEGLVHHFPTSSLLGLIAPPTPFETGRDHTLFYDGPGEQGEEVHEIFDQGAVGLALVAPKERAAGSEVPVVDVEMAYANLHPMGLRHTLTGAEGNVISTLDGENAVEQFRKAIESRPIRRPDHECVFRIGIYLAGQTTPDVMATIVGGQSSRGALLLNTDANLGELLQKSHSATVQFFQEDPGSDVTPAPRDSDAADQGNVRVLFANPGGGDADAPRGIDGKVATWRGTFAAASPAGWFQAYATKVPGSAVWMTIGEGCSPVP